MADLEMWCSAPLQERTCWPGGGSWLPDRFQLLASLGFPLAFKWHSCSPLRGRQLMTEPGSGTRGQTVHEVALSQHQRSSPLHTFLQQRSALELPVGPADIPSGLQHVWRPSPSRSDSLAKSSCTLHSISVSALQRTPPATHVLFFFVASLPCIAPGTEQVLNKTWQTGLNCPLQPVINHVLRHSQVIWQMQTEFLVFFSEFCLLIHQTCRDLKAARMMRFLLASCSLKWDNLLPPSLLPLSEAENFPCWERETNLYFYHKEFSLKISLERLKMCSSEPAKLEMLPGRTRQLKQPISPKKNHIKARSATLKRPRSCYRAISQRTEAGTNSCGG